MQEPTLHDMLEPIYADIEQRQSERRVAHQVALERRHQAWNAIRSILSVRHDGAAIDECLEILEASDQEYNKVLNT